MDYEAAWEPQPGAQTAAIYCPITDILFGGARGGGKTSWILGDCLYHNARHAPFGRAILFRRSYDELDEVKDQAAEIYNRIGAKWSASKSTWTFPFGGFLKLRYLAADRDAERYQGHQYNWAAIDEAGNFPSPDPINKIRATLRDKRGIPLRFPKTANPGGVGHAWLKERYIDPAPGFTPIFDEETGEHRIFIPSKLTDNKILMANDPGYVNRLKGAGAAWLVNAWLNGDWNATPEGGIIKADWLKNLYDFIPDAANVTVHSWDTAYKAKAINDPSVCTMWNLGRGVNRYYLRDLFRARMEYPSLKQKIKDLAEIENPAAILIEDKASGQSLIQELKSETRLPIIAVTPTADKETRMFACSTAFESGLVMLPRTAIWKLDYEIELTTFPQAPHDDRVDSTSQFLNWVRNWSMNFTSASTGRRASVIEREAAQVQTTRGYGSVKRRATIEDFI